MKKIMKIKALNVKVLFFLILSGALTACTTTNAPVLPKTPEAKAAYDNSSAGIVKGVLVGSTGVFKFNIKNNNDSIYCLVTFDGATGMLLPTTNLSTWQIGQAFAATFSGTVGSSQVSVYFKCNADGSSPSATFTIPNHTVNVSLFKETSTNLVKGYEGTYVSNDLKTNAKNDEGTFNIISYNGIVKGYHTGTGGSGEINGTINGNKLTIDNDVLTIDDTSISGTIVNSDSKITVVGKRTL